MATHQEVPPSTSNRRTALLSLAALGVVYGDIGTSPLYAIRECFHGEYGIDPTHANILGVLSLIFWSLISIVSIKYLAFILRADNEGEGGVIALTAQLLRHNGGRATAFLILCGLFAAALLYGDGMITPAISVLSAIEGVAIVVPKFAPWVVPLTVVILLALFSLQRYGTTRVGSLFGPVTGTWFVVIAALGIRGIVQNPEILEAVSPVHAVRFLATNAIPGFVVLGAVVLVVTGAEALFADMGHFGKRPIRIAWYGLVLPALLCNYFGQGALLLASPEHSYHPFYALVPNWAYAPMIVLATAATIIASQAVISGAFSLTGQAIQLGYLPRMRIVHSSPTEPGQIFIPQINAMLMVCTIGLVLGFQSSSQLAAAYGVAVTLTMTMSTILFVAVARRRWGWSIWLLGVLAIAFLTVDVTFLGANLVKITHGAWFPLVIGGAVFVVMTTWRKGRKVLEERLYAKCPELDALVADLERDSPVRVPGKAVYMAGSLRSAPPALVHNFQSNHVLHEEVATLTIVTEDLPRVEREEKVEVRLVGAGFWQIVAHYGFMEDPNVPHLLALAREKGLAFELEDVVFFLGRERIVAAKRPALPRWRQALFSFLSLNAQGATRYFHIPPDQVVEIGAQIQM